MLICTEEALAPTAISLFKKIFRARVSNTKRNKEKEDRENLGYGMAYQMK